MGMEIPGRSQGTPEEIAEAEAHLTPFHKEVYGDREEQYKELSAKDIQLLSHSADYKKLGSLGSAFNCSFTVSGVPVEVKVDDAVEVRIDNELLSEEKSKSFVHKWTKALTIMSEDHKNFIRTGETKKEQERDEAIRFLTE